MSIPKNENAVFSGIKVGLEEAIAYERGELTEEIRIHLATHTESTDEKTVKDISQRLIKKNQKALEKLTE